MNTADERFFTNLDEAIDAVGTLIVLVDEKEIVARTIRPGAWALTMQSTGRIGRIERREEGRAVYFVGYTAEDPDTVDWVSDDIDRIFDRLVRLS